MIQLASDPNASRMKWQGTPTDEKGNPLKADGATSRRHAWPFISRYTDKPVAPAAQQTARTEHGS